MKKLGRIAPVLALALLLSACGGPEPQQTPEPTPPPSGVAVHWDVLTPRPENIAERRYEGYTDRLIPADDYGDLMPYIGGEAATDWEQSWFYGLATHDGEIVTDPVYTEVNALGWFDYRQGKTRHEDVLILRSAVPTGSAPSQEPAPDFEDRYGLAAIDGSWYTGQIYTMLICDSQLGALLFDTAGDAVMIGLDGQEIFRWKAGAIPVDGLDPDDAFGWIANTVGPYMEFMSGYDGYSEPTVRYVDLRSGAVYNERPADYDDEYVEQDYVSGDRVITGIYGENRLEDLEGNVLLTTNGRLDWMYMSYGDGLPLCVSTIYETDEETGEYIVTNFVYSRDGELICKAQGEVMQWGDRLMIADETSYRVTDFEGNDLIRLTRQPNL